MILVTVGTERYPFNRLMNWVTVLLQYQFMAADVIVQYGSCTILPPGVKVFQSLKGDKFADLIEQADLVISHCGEGSILLLEDTDKPYILVPRSSKLGEHVDDHQIELAIALEQSGATIAWSPGDLARFCAYPQRRTISTLSNRSTNALCQILERDIQDYYRDRTVKTVKKIRHA